MARSTPLVFFGSDGFSVVVLEGLIKRGWPISLVITAPERAPAGRTPPSSPVTELARRHRLNLSSPNKPTAGYLAKLKAQLPGWAVLASYGQILTPSALDMFTAIVNVHPSLLPRWRGPSPIEAVILAGEKQTGVSLMKLAAKMDAGPVYAQAKTRLSERDDQVSLEQKLAELGRDLLIEKLPDIISGRLSPEPQDDKQATYCQLIKKSDAQLDWSEPAVTLERKIRAYALWPKARAEILGRDVIVTKASVVDGKGQPGQVSTENGGLVVNCGQDALSIKRLKPAGRAEMSAVEFLRGYRS